MNMNAKTKRMKRGTAMLLSMLMTFSSANLQTFAWGASQPDLSESEPASMSNASRPQKDHNSSDSLASGSNAKKEKTVFF